MTNQVHVGIVGTSQAAQWRHLESLKEHPHAKIAAICGRNQEKAKNVANHYDNPPVFADYREMLDKSSLDALIIVVPDDLHYSITMDALDAGLHVLCEKPIAVNATQAREMYEKAEAVGVTHMVYFIFRWLPLHRYLQQLIDEGYIGRCFHLCFRQIMGYGRQARYGWRFDRKRANGVLGDIGSHLIDLARWYVGDITSVNARLGTYVDRPGIEGRPLDPANDSAILTLEFKNGTQGVIQVSAVAHVGAQGIQQQLSLHGESGSLEANVYGTEIEIRAMRQHEEAFQTLPIPDHVWGNTNRAKPFLVSYTEPLGDRLFIDAIVEDRLLSPTFYDGLKTQEVVDAALKSNQVGQKISLI